MQCGSLRGNRGRKKVSNAKPEKVKDGPENGGEEASGLASRL